MSNKLHWLGLGLWSAIVAGAVVACGGGGGSASAPDGSLRVAITDAPACGFQHVWVTIEKVRIHQSANAQDADAGWSEITLSPSKRVDLRTLTNGVLEELGTTPLAAGHYTQLRLVLANNSGGGSGALANAVQLTGGSPIPLTTPSAQQSGYKLLGNFDVASGQMADVVMDFDACHSVVTAGNSGQYLLKPVITVVPRVTTSISGVLTTTLTLSSTTVAAQQDGVTVRSTTPDSSGAFSIPFLQPGTYTLVITSDGHATGVITSVPAGTGTTVVSGTATAIVLPVSAMADIHGTVTASTLSGGSTVTAAVTDANVRALQTLTGGPVIEVATQKVDSVLGTYQFSVPKAAPVKAAYSTATLALTPDTAVAGKYTVETQAPGRATLTKPADVSGTSSLQLDFGY
jgi:hypothetical protein